MSTPSLPFSTFCDFLSSLRKIKPTKAKQSTKESQLAARTAVLKRFQDWIDSGFNNFYDSRETAPEGTSVILFRLLFPDEGVRRRYDLRESLLAGELVKSTCFKKSLKPSFVTDWNHGEIEVERSDCSGCLGIELQENLEGEGLTGGDLTIAEVDTLLDELASMSKWSSVKRKAAAPRRKRSQIIHELYYRLSASEAGFMTQIILRDLTPILYPPPSRLRGDALNMYNSKAYYKFTLQDALRLWHPRLSEMYRFCADLDLVLRRIEQGDTTPRIDLFTPCQVAKTVRPGTTKASMKNLQGVNSVEVKYDGFRMQIHFDATKPCLEQLEIFSKSTRNSTTARGESHHILRAAFGHSQPHDQVLHPHLYRRAIEGLFASPETRDTIQSGIFEAEMICYSELKGCDELFHKLATVLAGRQSIFKMAKAQSPMSEESSIQTGQSSMEVAHRRFERFKRSQADNLHLKIVFFDVLYLNGTSLIDESYETRRNRLERLIRPIRNYSMIAERKLIDFGDERSDRSRALQSLRRFFAEVIVDRGEGLMIKNVASIPHSYKNGFRTVKLKKDFIPGCGDTLDFVILGARWDRDRGRELGVPPSVLTTFFVGLLVDGGGKKRYAIQFTTSYGLSRSELQQLNNLVAAHHQPQRFLPQKGCSVHFIDERIPPLTLDPSRRWEDFGEERILS